VKGSRSDRWGLWRNGFSATTGCGVLGRSSIGMFDLDFFHWHSEVLRNDHGHHGVGSCSNIACSHVQIDTSIGKKLDEDGGRRSTPSRNPKTTCHSNTAAEGASTGIDLGGLFQSLFPSKSLGSFLETFFETCRSIR